jgi:DNA gyrase inhibitor GyrI
MSETRTLHPEYISKINKTFDYIESNLDKPMTLEELASIANFSKFHFNRIFQSIVGETPFHDDPKVALSDKLRMSLCITVPPETKVGGEIGKMEIGAARYAIAHFELTSNDFQAAWEWLYGQWLPNSSYELDDKPYFETYPEAPKGEKFIVDFCVPVKPI